MTQANSKPVRQGPNRVSSRELRKRVGANVRRLRKARQMTQQQLAESIAEGYCKNTVSDVERGRRNLTLASLHAFAAGLNCCESQLLLPRAPSSVHPPPAQPAAGSSKRPHAVGA